MSAYSVYACAAKNTVHCNMVMPDPYIKDLARDFQ
jgi:hypothetical protein